MIFSDLKFLQANLRGRKGCTFIAAPGWHLASLCHCSWLHWPIPNQTCAHLFYSMANRSITEVQLVDHAWFCI